MWPTINKDRHKYLKSKIARVGFQLAIYKGGQGFEVGFTENKSHLVVSVVGGGGERIERGASGQYSKAPRIRTWIF